MLKTKIKNEVKVTNIFETLIKKKKYKYKVVAKCLKKMQRKYFRIKYFFK